MSKSAAPKAKTPYQQVFEKLAGFATRMATVEDPTSKHRYEIWLGPGGFTMMVQRFKGDDGIELWVPLDQTNSLPCALDRLDREIERCRLLKASADAKAARP